MSYSHLMQRLEEKQQKEIKLRSDNIRTNDKPH